MEIKVDPKDMVTNPWNVDTLEEFLYYCCPECDLKSKDYTHFYDHAVQCHQKAKETLEPQETELTDEDFDVKVEVKNEDISESDEENEPLVKRKRKSLYKNQCYYCGEGFKGPSHSIEVKDHISNSHTKKVTSRMFGKPLDYQCDQCQMMFKDEESLKMHICGLVPPFWHGESVFAEQKCPKCDKTLSNYRHLLNHYALTHREEKKFECDQCDFSTFTGVKLRQHKSCHEMSLTCDICHNSYKSIVTLKKHKREIHEGKKTPSDRFKNQIKCDMCDFRGKISQVKIHKSQVHPEGKTFKCDLCDMEYSLESEMKKHRKRQHEAHNICHICGKGFYYPSKLKEHMTLAHLEVSQNVTECDFTCDKCGKSYGTKAQLSIHENNVHAQKCYLCTLCDRFFSGRAKLVDHLSTDHQYGYIYIPDGIYPCDKCDKKFVTCPELNSHLVSQHELQCEFQCHQCPKSFVYERLLTVHCTESHNLDLFKATADVTPHDGKFKCDICGDCLKSEKGLRDHVKHNHEKESHSFKCELCHFTSHQAARLRVHVRRKHEKIITRYSCTECSRTFSQKRNLKIHLLDEHSIFSN